MDDYPYTDRGWCNFCDQGEKEPHAPDCLWLEAQQAKEEK
jgi:hypothetical protein